MAKLKEIVQFCDARVRRSEIKDFPGSENGLQAGNNGTVTRIGAAVDAGLEPFRKAAAAGVDFLIVHHGLYWTPPCPLTGPRYQKVKTLLDHNIALYGAHLPLDAHPEIGNNALLADELGMDHDEWFLDYAGTDIGLLANWNDSRERLQTTLREHFPRTVAMEYGSEHPRRVAIVTGAGGAALDVIKGHGVDTLITGELKQHHFNQAQEEGINLYLCGHYATETFGVKALAAEAADRFDLEWTFIETECPL